MRAVELLILWYPGNILELKCVHWSNSMLKHSLRYLKSCWKTGQVTCNRSAESTYLHSALFVAFERFPALPLFSPLLNTNTRTLECWPWPITVLSEEYLKSLPQTLSIHPRLVPVRASQHHIQSTSQFYFLSTVFLKYF